ncbi:MAG: hypothetical protein CVV53_00390 [Spirochaetae bacterium HGW-Spirochaetae-9]|nr:MAG: hypothetical protein CVV53_00390 [Spirochaetae bacterium HGW-Spirochaetae-9]
MKIVRVSGGLGNQLFQYAFARALELRTGDEVFLDLSTYGYEAAHNGFELDRLFPVSYKAAAEKDIIRLGTRPQGPLSQLRRKFFTKRTHHIDRLFRFDPEVFGLKGDRYFEGWWQTERYFAPCADRLREELRFIADPGERNVALLRDIAGAGGPVAGDHTLVSVHVRRGDALKNPDTWVCTEAYYQRALNRAREGRKPYFLVFSDDLAWCREHLDLSPDEATFVDWNRGAESWRDMWLMSRCSAHIVANSTFSWWGAWLDPSPDKLVLAPERWSLARPQPFAYYRYSFDEVVPESWIRIPVE